MKYIPIIYCKLSQYCEDYTVIEVMIIQDPLYIYAFSN